MGWERVCVGGRSRRRAGVGGRPCNSRGQACRKAMPTTDPLLRPLLRNSLGAIYLVWLPGVR